LIIPGWYYQFPVFHFVQKCNGTISLTGEKLHERQFIEAVHETEKNLGKQLKFFVGFADITTSGYKFYYEFTDNAVSMEQATAFTAKVDEILKKYNEEYATKRDSNRVKTPETALLVQDSFEKFKAECIEKGYRDGQFKLNLLMQDEKRQAMFETLVRQ
jgi:hypothetical protein